MCIKRTGSGKTGKTDSKLKKSQVQKNDSKRKTRKARKKTLDIEQLLDKVSKNTRTLARRQATILSKRQNESQKTIKILLKARSPLLEFFKSNDNDYLIEDDTFNGTTLNYITGNFGITIPINFLRVIFSDFMALFRQDDHNIDPTIAETCNANYEHNQICYCCGNVIYPADLKSCDHLIPILTMVIIVNLQSIPNNLFFTHRDCNSDKGDINIIDLYNKVGKNRFFSRADDNPAKIQKCQDRIMEILQKIMFNDKHTIHFKLGRIERVAEHYKGIKDNINLLSNTIQAHTVVHSLLGLQPSVLGLQPSVSSSLR